MATKSFTVGDQHSDFECVRIEALPDLRATALEFKHIKTGAKLLHLHTEDVENCFGVIFPTPPPDETGLPHILEHSTLAGSKKYPVREPFFEIIKISMATFINAFTAQCFTAYPVCSTVERDFFNLADVYMDAVFHPQLTQNTFKREGHHLALKDNSDLNSDLIISGIVYSEMKGYWSTPDNMLANLGTRGLFPDTPLHRDSGGNPTDIPELTHDQFVQFHNTYYHPSNAHFYIYGNIETHKHLDFIAPLLKNYQAKKVDISVPRQPHWNAPRQVECTYPIGANDDDQNRSYAVINWLVGDATDPDTAMAWSVLSTILLGHDAAPLKKVVIDSKLGSDIYSSGDFSHAHELIFDVGIQGCSPDKSHQFEKLVLETLAKIAADEITPEMVDTALHQQAYHLLEVEKNFPLKLLWLCGESWPYEKDPLAFMHMKKELETCRAKYDADPQFFNQMIRDGLLNNTHRMTVIIHPERGAEAKAELEFAEKMRRKRAELSPEEIARIAKEAAELSAEQTKPNSPEQLASLPQLNISELPEKPTHIPTAISEVSGITVLRNDVFSNGVNYLNIGIDISGLPTELYPAIQRFTKAFTKMGTDKLNFAETAQLRASLTGSLNCNLSIQQAATPPLQPLRHIMIGMKTIDDKAPAALELLHSLIFNLNPNDNTRLLDIMTQSQTALRNTLINNGLSAAIHHAGRGITPEANITHQLESGDALHLISQQLNDFENSSAAIIADIITIRNFLQDASRWTVSFTGSDKVFDTLRKTLDGWNSEMSASQLITTEQSFSAMTGLFEGLSAPIKVAHCAKVMPAPGHADPATPLYELGLYLTNFDYFLPEIRFKGNAYGAGSQYNPSQGTLALFSYNDPRIVETINVFDNVCSYVNKADWSQTDINRAIIGSAKKIVQPIRPQEANHVALLRHISGLTNQMREQKYNATRAATPQTVKATLLEQLELAEQQANFCVTASRENLEQANSKLANRTLTIKNVLDPTEA